MKIAVQPVSLEKPHVHAVDIAILSLPCTVYLIGPAAPWVLLCGLASSPGPRQAHCIEFHIQTSPIRPEEIYPSENSTCH